MYAQAAQGGEEHNPRMCKSFQKLRQCVIFLRWDTWVTREIMHFENDSSALILRLYVSKFFLFFCFWFYAM